MELPYYAIEITNLFPHLIQTNPGILPRTPSFAKLWRWTATLASSRAPGVWYLGEAWGRPGRAVGLSPVEGLGWSMLNLWKMRRSSSYPLVNKQKSY